MLLLVQLFLLVLDHLQNPNSYFVFHQENRLHHDDFEVYYSEHWTSKTEHRQLYTMVSELNQVTNTDIHSNQRTVRRKGKLRRRCGRNDFVTLTDDLTFISSKRFGVANKLIWSWIFEKFSWLWNDNFCPNLIGGPIRSTQRQYHQAWTKFLLWN